MKKMKRIWACMAGLTLPGATMFLDGCGPKRGQLVASVAASVAVERGKGQDAMMYGGTKLNLDEAQSSCEDLLRDNVSDYPLLKYIDTVMDENNKTVMLTWPLDNAVTEEDGIRYANELICALNDACVEQDFSIAASSEKSYGGSYQKYAVSIQVFRETGILKPNKYLVSMTIPADSNQAVVPSPQYDGVSEAILMDGSVKVPGGKYTGDRMGLYNGE